MKIDWHGGQIQGERRRQEDAFALESLDGVWAALVADGLGGHPAGDVASREAIHVFGQALRRGIGRSGTAPALRAALNEADDHLRALQIEHPDWAGMATTLVALLIEEGQGTALSVGDSYLLHLRDGHMQRLNVLHTEGGGLTSCVGYHLARIDVTEQLEVRAGDRFLLASDGVLTLAETEVFKMLQAATTAKDAVTTMLGALEARAEAMQDNATLVAVFVN